LVKADIQKLAPEKQLVNGRYAPQSRHSAKLVMKGR
jgi:hypothetical protein